MFARIKRFFCTADPRQLAFWSIIIIVLTVEVIILKLWVFFIVAGTVLIFLGVLIGLGYGLYRLIKWAQFYCQKDEV